MAGSNPPIYPFLFPLFFSTWPFRLLYSSLIMTVIETIMRDIQSLSLRQQVEVARYVQRLSETARRKRVAVLSQTYGSGYRVASTPVITDCILRQPGLRSDRVQIASWITSK